MSVQRIRCDAVAARFPAWLVVGVNSPEEPTQRLCCADCDPHIVLQLRHVLGHNHFLREGPWQYFTVQNGYSGSKLEC